MNGIRRSQRLPIYLAAGALIILAVVYSSGSHVNAIAKSKSWVLGGEGSAKGHKGSWFGMDEDLSSLEEDGTDKSPLAVTTEETIIPSTPIPSNPTTQQKAHVHGFTVFDKLYLKGGTLYVVTSDPDFPPRNVLLAKPLPLGAESQDYTPTDEELTYLAPAQAREVLGEYATRLDGVTLLSYDPSQFMNHFYHWWGETVIGAWRVYSSLGLKSPGAMTSLPLISRFLLPVCALLLDESSTKVLTLPQFVNANEWRDKADVNGPLMRATFPQASIERADYWSDLKKLNTTFVFERVIVTNRYVAHQHPFGAKWFKMIAGAMDVTAPERFWERIRKSMVRNILGYVPAIDSNGRVSVSSMVPSASPSGPLDLGSQGWGLPVVTYISRQGTGRRLRNEDHQNLVKALQQLEEDGVCILQIPMMERLSLRDQIDIIAKTTIMVGVHGNGLTHQLIMPPSLRSATFEIMDPPSYTFDYEILARNLGHKHYAVNNDTLITFPRGETHEGVHYTENFHSEMIPVYAPTVADMIRLRLTQPLEDVED
ncbi:hypothetical protein BKA70DRAFT_252565 [Coprinopsis sp. MPI-PUGE-AT-0042]|nr:hypothetical protein BKA70DRAFT_252565 [Coprinopsis sp. MPI-PUGE-AT-0042]